MSANPPTQPQSGPGGAQPVGDGGPGAYPQQGMYQNGPPAGYGQPPYPGQQPGVGDRAAPMMQNVGRHIRTPEAKPFFMTSEFLVWLITVIGIVIAGAVVGSGDHGDVMRANLVWILLTAISFADIISPEYQRRARSTATATGATATVTAGIDTAARWGVPPASPNLARRWTQG